MNRLFSSLRIVVTAVAAVLVFTHTQAAPSLKTLSKSCFILHDPSGKYDISPEWEEPAKVMHQLPILPDLTKRIRDVITSDHGNKSVLIVGDASSAYRYFLASLAVSGDPQLAKFAHLEIDLPKIVEGHTLLGQVQEYWQKNISKPALGEDIILYISNLSSMIGLGASNRSSTGVETLFAPNIQGGKMRSVAFIDYFNYSRVRSDNNYVINSFGDTVFLPEYGSDDINGILLNYARAYIPQLKLTEPHVNYIKDVIGYYQPNKPEPQRTLTVFKELVTMMEEAVAKNGRFVMDKATLKAASMKAAQVPDWIIAKDFSVLKELPGKIRSRFIGQDEAVDGVVRLSRIGYGGGRTDEKPVASIMFAGPTGTGKTYLSKLLSKSLGLKMITMDMTTYRSSVSMDRFLAVMTDNLTINPHAVYVFEEIDKANVQVLDRLYFLLDEGIFYDRNQKPMYARGCYVIMTTNAGYDVIVKNRDKANVRELFELALLDRFRPSFLNRFDEIAMFRPFTDPEYIDMAKLHIRLKADGMKETYNWNLTVDDAIHNLIASESRSLTFGARPTLRMINGILSLGVTNYQIEKAPLEEGSNISLKLLSAEDHRFRLSVEGGSSLDYRVNL
ncbi:MAG: AAA family ATPase [Verrucomicrobiota bacterium]|nr:AAA family ATPase [Verrucomicrobiota bacterium]